MGTRNIENNGPNTIYVGGKLIAPGESRDIDERDLPPEMQGPAVAILEETAAPSLDDLVNELREKSVPVITAELPGLTQETLDRLNELETGDPIPRTTLLTALGNEHLRRANDAMVSDPL